jgi:hypothetical protein
VLDDFTVRTFSEHLGGAFRVYPEDSEPFDVELISASGVGEESEGGRPFSVVFRGSADVALPQRTYRMEHAGIGAFEIFLVPIGPDEKGPRYEAVFN